MFRRFAAAALLAAGFLTVSLAPSFAGEVDWAQPPFDNILKLAKSQNKHVFIDFYATWCGPCKRLDKVTYQDANVVEYLNGIVAVKYDAEKDEGEVLAKKFSIKAYPTLVLLGPDGKEVDRHIGYLDAEPFLEVFEGYQNGIGTVAYYEGLLEKNPNDTETLLILGRKHAEAVRADEAAAVFAKLLEIDPDSEHKAEIYSELGYSLYAADRFEEAAGYYNKLIAEFPDSEDYDRALQMLASVYYKMGKSEESVKSYLVLVDRHPDDTSVLNGFAWFCAQRKIGFDEALPVALKAVDLSDRDAGILDTLAELYYAMGDYPNAIKIGEEAATKSPDDEYLKDQLQKYRKAADDSDQASR